MKTTTRESLKGRMSVFTITMALSGLALSGSTMALTDELDSPVGVELGIPNLGELSMMGSTPIPGLTIEKTGGVAHDEAVVLVEPGVPEDPLGSLWTVRVGDGTFVTVVSVQTEDQRVSPLYFGDYQENCQYVLPPNIVANEEVCFISQEDKFWVCLGDVPCVQVFGHRLRAAPCLLFDELGMACEPVAHLADIADPNDAGLEFPPTGFRLCVYEAYLGIDLLPPEGEDDFGTTSFLLPELVEDTVC